MSARLAVLVLLSLLPLLSNGQERERSMRDFLGLGPPPDAAAAQAGEPLYKQNCSGCHGENARGGQAPNLTRSTLVLHDQKGEEIAPVVKNGRPGAGMPAFPNLTAAQVYDIAEYIHLQIENAANRGAYKSVYANQRAQTSGDAAQGAAFFAASCGRCHSASGDLAKIGAKFSDAASLEARFLWPSSKEHLKGTVTTAGGDKFEGEFLKVNDFEVVLRDSAGAIHNWPRDGVQVQVEDKLDGHRALLPKYSDADLHNLTAYLLTLK